jgi:hypothetical protein
VRSDQLAPSLAKSGLERASLGIASKQIQAATREFSEDRVEDGGDNDLGHRCE